VDGLKSGDAIMNAVVETINAAGGAFVEFALPMLVQSNVLIVILLLIDAVLRHRGRAVFRYWIWMLVLVKLILPVSLWSPVSIGRWLGDPLAAPTSALYELGEPRSPEPATEPRSIATSVPPEDVPAPTISPALPVEGPAPGTPQQRTGADMNSESLPRPAASSSAVMPAPSLTWQGLVLLSWAAVAIGLLLLLVQRSFFVRGLVAQADEASGAMQDNLNRCRRWIGLRREVTLKVSMIAGSPAACGLIHPVILIPQSLSPQLQPHDLQVVLLHELAHIKRGDLWISLVQTLLQIAYFYNPLLWLANAMIRRTREQAVDEAVLVAMGETAPQYPETLINVAKLAFRKRPGLSLRLIGVVESRSTLTARIRHILNRPTPKTTKLSLLSLSALFLSGMVLLPMAKARPLAEWARNVGILAAKEAKGRKDAGANTAATLDTDGDGLSDFQEVHKYLTDPMKKDSDGDGTPDGDWNERREYTYSVRTVLRYLPPFDAKGLNDDFQDARVLKQTSEHIEIEVIHYPLATGYDAVPENPDWRRDNARDARLAEYLAPGVTTNWDEQMRRDLSAALKADGIDVDTLTDKQVVERVSAWLLKRSRSLDSVFTTYYVDFPQGNPRVYPGLEDAFRHEFERDSRHYDWSIEQHFDHELLGKGMFYNKTHGSCTSTAVYLTTVLRAIGIPTRMILATPVVDASDRAEVLMVKNAITHNRVRLTMLAGLGRSSHGWTNHTFNEVYVGNRWCRLDYSQLGCPAFGASRFGLQTHLYTFNDLSDVNFAPTWGWRYAKGERSNAFQHDNPYSAVEVSELFGPHGNIPNPPFTAQDLASHPQPDIFLFYPARLNVWQEFVELVEGGTFNKTGRSHQRESYENLFDGIWLTRPWDILVMLLSLDTPERIPEGYEDLLPKPWPEIESALRRGETVELSGKAREMNIILLAAPTSDELRPLVQNSRLLNALRKPGAPPARSPAPILTASAEPVVKLDNGVTLELLGVCKHPSEGRQWWRPDGSPLEPAPYKANRATEMPQAGLRWYEFAVRLAAPDDAHVRWVIAGGKHGSDSGPPIGHTGEYRRDLRSYKATLPEGQEATEIRLGVAVGAWRTRAMHPPLDAGSYPLDESRAIAFGVTYEKDGSTYLPVTTNFTGDQIDYEVVAVDEKGTTHRAGGSRGGGHVLLSMTCRWSV
jgi:beta-lactamase regulating signal transducer with metallopeptidase domain